MKKNGNNFRLIVNVFYSICSRQLYGTEIGGSCSFELLNGLGKYTMELALTLKKRAVLAALFLSVPVLAQQNTGSLQTGLNSLSSCEQDIYAAIPTTKKAIIQNGGAAIATGAAFGTTIFGAGFVLESLGSSTSSIVQILGGPELTGSMPSKGLIISAVASGTVVAAIAVSAGYFDYIAQVATGQDLLQFFRDVKNQSMGPQIEIRVNEVKTALRKVSLIDRIIGNSGPKYSSETFEEKNIIQAYMEIGNELLTSKFDSPCKSITRISKRIDESVMKLLIVRYNPHLKVEIK